VIAGAPVSAAPDETQTSDSRPQSAVIRPTFYTSPRRLGLWPEGASNGTVIRPSLYTRRRGYSPTRKAAGTGRGTSPDRNLPDVDGGRACVQPSAHHAQAIRPTEVWMTTTHAPDDALSPELEAIAAAGHDRLQAQAGQDLSEQETAQRRVAEAASAAIVAGAALSAIADAERSGELRARRALCCGTSPRGEVQARGRQRIRAGHRSASGGSDSHTATSPPPPRSRTAPSARSSPAAAQA
jgi:hypothetical protein